MAISFPKSENLPSGDLARVINHEPNADWPEIIEIVAYWGPGRRRRKSVEISADQFFGKNGHNAPITGDNLIQIVDRLRRTGP